MGVRLVSAAGKVDEAAGASDGLTQGLLGLGTLLGLVVARLDGLRRAAELVKLLDVDWE